MKVFFFILLLLILNSCSYNKELINVEVLDKNEEIYKEKIENYFIGKPYTIDGVQYIPEENYNYSETGTASFFDKSLHGKKTENGEIINITELIAFHKTLPLPSLVKITNIDNNTSVIARINGRGPSNNFEIIKVSRQVAILLNFYEKKIANVKVEILADQSKHLKVIAESINFSDSTNTIEAAPTTDVSVEDLKID
tara:strand:+ start:858 stop:1448 length:591 start_codon:yes stop_codon:yes gene_type:complete